MKVKQFQNNNRIHMNHFTLIFILTLKATSLKKKKPDGNLRLSCLMLQIYVWWGKWFVSRKLFGQKIFWWSIYDWPSPGYCCVKKLVLWKWLKSVIVGQWRQLKVTICHTVPIKGCIYFCLDVFSWHFYTRTQLRTQGSKYFSWFNNSEIILIQFVEIFS